MSQDSYENFIQKNLGVVPSEMEYKRVQFKISPDTKVLKRKGEEIFIFEGYASTPALDRGGDVVAPGAFRNTIDRKKMQGNRPIRMKYQHDMKEIIGGFPIEHVREDEKGLWVVGEICLGVQRGRETAALIKGGFLSDLSIGFNVVDFEMKDNARVIKDLELWEISVVDEPMNPESEIMNFKSVVPFHDLPLAPDSHPWDKSAAERRVRGLTDSKIEPSKGYRKAFFWFDSAKSDEFTAYKLPFADVVGGKLQAVPRALYAVAGVLDGARGGVDIPEADKSKIKNQVEKYYKKMGKESPFKTKSSIHRITVPELKGMLCDPRSAEQLIKSLNIFSKSSAIYLGGLLSNLHKSKARNRRAEEDEEEFERGGKYMAEEGHPRPGENFRYDDDEEEAFSRPKRSRSKADGYDQGAHEEEMRDRMQDELEELEEMHEDEKVGRRKRKLKVKEEPMFDSGPMGEVDWNEDVDDDEYVSRRRKKKPGFDLAEDEMDPEFQSEVEDEEGRLARRKRRKREGADIFVDEDDPAFQRDVSEEEGRLARRKRRMKAEGDDIFLDEEDPGFQDEVDEEEGRLARRKRRRKAEAWDDVTVNENDEIRDLQHRERELEDRERTPSRRKSSDDDDVDYIDDRDFDKMTHDGDDDDMDERNMQTYRVMRKLLREARKLVDNMRGGY